MVGRLHDPLFFLALPQPSYLGITFRVGSTDGRRRPSNEGVGARDQMALATGNGEDIVSPEKGYCSRVRWLLGVSYPIGRGATGDIQQSQFSNWGLLLAPGPKSGELGICARGSPGNKKHRIAFGVKPAPTEQPPRTNPKVWTPVTDPLPQLAPGLENKKTPGRSDYYVGR